MASVVGVNLFHGFGDPAAEATEHLPGFTIQEILFDWDAS
jgi:hypothetical protein